MRLLTATALLVMFCAAACAKKAPPPAAPLIPTPAAQTAAPQPVPATPPAEPEPKTEQRSAAAPALGDAYTANKSHNEGTREGDKKLERDLSRLRPKNREYVSLDGTDIEVKFTGAKEGPPGSHLSDLSFELTDGKHNADATMTDKQRTAAMTVDLGWCKVKVLPVISSADVKPIGAGEVASRVTRSGSYDVILLDKAGKRMGAAQITSDRRLLSRYAGDGYECFMRRDPEWEDEMIYTIIRTTGDQSKVLQMRWTDKALDHQQVVDKVGSVFEYSFPTGELELIKPD